MLESAVFEAKKERTCGWRGRHAENTPRRA